MLTPEFEYKVEHRSFPETCDWRLADTFPVHVVFELTDEERGVVPPSGGTGA